MLVKVIISFPSVAKKVLANYLLFGLDNVIWLVILKFFA